MGVKYRKNENWEFEVIEVKSDNINKGITSQFQNNKKYGVAKNIDIIETEVIDKDYVSKDIYLKILVKFAII